MGYLFNLVYFSCKSPGLFFGLILYDCLLLACIETGTLKMRDMKLRDMKMRHQLARVEIASHENAINAIVWNTACCICLSIAEQECMSRQIRAPDFAANCPISN